MSDEPSFPLDSLRGATSMHTAEIFDKHYRRFKGQPVIGLFFAFTPAVGVYDLGLIQSVLVKDFTSFHDRYLYYNEKDDPLSANLLSIEGNTWKERRTKVTPVFTSGKIKMMFDTISSIGDKFAEVIMDKSKITAEIEVSEWLYRFTTDVIGNIAFGIDCNCLENPETEFRKHSKRIFKIDTPLSALRMMLISSFQNFSRKMKFGFNEKEVADFFFKVFSETVEYREKNKIERNDFIQQLLIMKNKGLLDLKEMAAESFIFYFGGFHTSASVMNFILYELALNQGIQMRLRREIVDSLDAHNGEINYESILEMKYLEMVVSESLRKHPPVNVLTRKCTKDYQVPGTKLMIPKDTQVTIPIYSIQRDPEYFPEPERFDPERFSDENIQNIKPFTYMPFGKILCFPYILNLTKDNCLRFDLRIIFYFTGEGPRICIGLRFALISIKIALVKLLSQFEFDKSQKTLIPMKYSNKCLVLSPDNEELYLKVKRI